MSANYVRYIKELRPIVGSFAAAILWEDLVFKFKKHTKGFWKFLKPCNHMLYKVGDSWLEELGFKNENEFRTTFAKIGVTYQSRKQFEEAENPFVKNGKEYCFASFRDRADNLTHYRANTKLINEITEKYLKNQKRPAPTPKSKSAPKSKPAQEPKPVAKPAPEQFEFDKFNWPSQLEKNEENIKILKDLTHDDTVKVLAVFDQNAKKNGIRTTATRLLAGLVNKHKKGELIINDEITTKLEHNKWKQKAKECPYCDDEGYLELEKHDGEKLYVARCDHPKYIKWDNIKRVITARPGSQTKQEREAQECPYCNKDEKMELLLTEGSYITKPCEHKKIEMSWQEDGYYVKKILSAKEGYADPPIRSSFWSASEAIKKVMTDCWGIEVENTIIPTGDEVPF